MTDNNKSVDNTKIDVPYDYSKISEIKFWCHANNKEYDLGEFFESVLNKTLEALTEHNNLAHDTIVGYTKIYDASCKCNLCQLMLCVKQFDTMIDGEKIIIKISNEVKSNTTIYRFRYITNFGRYIGFDIRLTINFGIIWENWVCNNHNFWIDPNKINLILKVLSKPDSADTLDEKLEMFSEIEKDKTAVRKELIEIEVMKNKLMLERKELEKQQNDYLEAVKKIDKTQQDNKEKLLNYKKTFIETCTNLIENIKDEDTLQKIPSYVV